MLLCSDCAVLDHWPEITHCIGKEQLPYVLAGTHDQNNDEYTLCRFGMMTQSITVVFLQKLVPIGYYEKTTHYMCVAVCGYWVYITIGTII